MVERICSVKGIDLGEFASPTNYRLPDSAWGEPYNKTYLDVLSEASKTIDIMCGSFSNRFYDSFGFMDVANRFLLLGDGNLSIVMNAGIYCPHEKEIESARAAAVEKLREQKREFLEMIKFMDKRYQEKVKFYWVPVRTTRHYTIVDDRTLLIEEDHETGSPRNILVWKYQDEMARRWKEGFNKIKNTPKCRPIRIEELL